MSDESPGGRFRSLVGVVRQTVENFLNQQGMQWAGAVAFYLVLSIPPLLIAATSIADAIVGSGEAQEYIVSTVTRFVPIEERLIDEIADETLNGIGLAALVSLGFLLFSGTRIFAALITAIHVMWEEVETAGFIRMQVTRGVFLIGVGLLLGLAVIVEVGIGLVEDAVPLGGIWLWFLESEFVPLLILFAALFMLFKLIPHKEATWTSAVIGAAVGALGLRIAQYGFGLFLETLADFETAYGPLAGIGALMTWALVASITILLAAHLVAVLNRPDTPTGGDRNVPGATDEKNADESDEQRTPGEQEGERAGD
jgi:membrane protein